MILFASKLGSVTFVWCLRGTDLIANITLQGSKDFSRLNSSLIVPNRFTEQSDALILGGLPLPPWHIRMLEFSETHPFLLDP